MSSIPGRSRNTLHTRPEISGPMTKMRPAAAKASAARRWKRASFFTAYSMALPWGMMVKGMRCFCATRWATTDISTAWLTWSAPIPCSPTTRSSSATLRSR